MYKFLKKKGLEHPQLGARHISPSYGTSSQAYNLMFANPIQALIYSSLVEILGVGDQVFSSNHSIFNESKNDSCFKCK
jgi:hypothetical protein